MARLNESQQPATESVDALKRRFVRQNRELARANSTQSLRIRNLESEVSRLLAENVDLREQIIKIQYECERSTSRAVQDYVAALREQLEAKLKELSGLVQDLGIAQNDVETERAQKRSPTSRNSPQRSPDQKNWKNVHTLSEVMGSADERLPPIMEGKYYPRRTMDADELQDILTDPANVIDSPDLGPPPVAHFEEGDPIKFDPHSKGENPNTLAAPQELRTALSANLETRKKRRESLHGRDGGDKRLATKPREERVPRDMSAMTSQTLKTGAKRKLIARDDEDLSLGTSTEGAEAFHFNRKTIGERTIDREAAKPNIGRSSKPGGEKAPRMANPTAQLRQDRSNGTPAASVPLQRKALEPKSVNTDPTNSPARLKSSSKDKVSEAKDELARIVREKKDNSVKRTVSKDPNPVFKKDAPMRVAELPPETPAPAPNDLFSPLSSEPSAARPESQDTPPPPDLGLETGTGSFGRASRRSRGPVNYAQPNLRDKMRRPTADLVDAVGAEERARQASIAKAEKEASGFAFIKQDESIDALPNWKTNDPKEGTKSRDEPASPLVHKTSAGELDLSNHVTTERRRRTIVPARNNENEEPAKPLASGAASAIAALTATRLRSKVEDDVSKKEEDNKGSTERPSIYDFIGSSPLDHGGSTKTKDVVEEPTRLSRSSRRHSSVPSSLNQEKGAIVISRRRETILGSSKDADAEDVVRPARSASKSTLEPVGSDGEASIGRGERAASRRRSMVL